MGNKINAVYRTKDYRQFKRLEGNRAVPQSRINKIKQSIQNVGYVQSPIVVNDKMEIIDGQGRVEALKSLELPVDYIVVNGIGINECRAMNINQSNWIVMDFVESYAEEGNDSYIFFQNLMKAYGKLGIVAVNNAVTGLASTNNEAIKCGKFVCTLQDYERAVKILDYEKRFIGIVKKMTGRADYIYIAIGFCYESECIDNDRLFEKLGEKYDRFHAPANVEQALDEISKIYNERLRGEKVFLSTDYKRNMGNKYGWYDKKYGTSRARHYA